MALQVSAAVLKLHQSHCEKSGHASRQRADLVHQRASTFFEKIVA
jgi:hypothetical protein